MQNALPQRFAEIHDIYFLLEVTSVLVRYPLERSSPSLFPLKLARF
jgi:hypothetical protein